MENENGEFKGYAKAMIEALQIRFNEFQDQMNRRFTGVETELNEIKTNHIVHLQARLDELEHSLSRNQVWLITTLATLVSGLLYIILNGK